ncbi:hypothetical protein [uncultured Jatrophihabitans sp.]|uniref:hypothetical protein n=1 Tax=uncultured Jatrophihabitans sp. TaxID=1610747 RepID=UPI0035C9E113
MARALVGHIGTNGERMLAVEIARLRRRVRELELENTQLREAGTAHSAELDLELHRIAEQAQPALA